MGRKIRYPDTRCRSYFVNFLPLPLKGAYAIETSPVEDRRGSFSRTFCQREFATRGLNPNVVQCSRSFNKKKGTLRGMHYQTEPCLEAKLVQCLSGSTHHVIIDLRADSATFLEWASLKLDCARRNMLYVPEGLAHGFLTLEDNSELYYQISEFYDPDSAAGVRWDDPAFGIDWPGEVVEISDRDQSYPDFELPA
jgi:dTDP-4-dehydrorhamnose 3,5-epimerase